MNHLPLPNELIRKIYQYIPPIFTGVIIQLSRYLNEVKSN